MTPERIRYATPPWVVATLAACCVLALLVALRSAPAGRFFALVVAVATGGEALRSAVLRPTLYANERGITVATMLRFERFAWSDVVHVGALAPPSRGGRLRRRAAALEIDVGDRLVVVPAYRLGAPVAEVVERLTGFSGSIPGS